MNEFISRRLRNVISVTKIVTVHYFEFSRDFAYCGDSHYMWEMIYVDRGNIISTAGEHQTVLRQGNVIFHKPHEFHNVASNKLEAPNLFIITFVTQSKAMSFFDGKTFRLSAKHRKLLSAIIEESSAAFEMVGNVFGNELKRRADAPIGAEQLIRLYLEEFLLLMLREQYEKNASGSRILLAMEPENDSMVSAIIRILRENLYANVSIDDICRQLNYGKTHVCTTFKRQSDYSIIQYYALLKIAEAKRLIRETDHSIGEIAALLCFESGEYFSRVFKRVAGMTPREYRRSVEPRS